MRRRVDTEADGSHYRPLGMGYGLGVDIGTTWTAAAIARAGSEPQVLSLGGRTAAVPTVVHVLPDRSANVGDAAERRAVTDPDRVAREFKRRIGDTTPVLLGGEPWSPESLLAIVLQWVLGRATELEGEPPDHIVVTHPANWGPLRRELLEQAVRHAGVEASYVTEPEAAAVHYAAAARVPEGVVVAVYDLGGGTFDATVLRKTAGGFELLGRPEGVERLGGLDFDAAVLGHVSGLLGPAWSTLDPADPATAGAVLRLRHDCVLAKEALSEDADAAIPVTLPTVSTEVRLTRSELEAMIRSPIEQSADALARAVAGASLTPQDIDRILLVGGSSRIPLVSQVLSSRFHRPLALDTHPKHAVALGAARLALAAGSEAPAPVVAPVAPVVEPPSPPSPPSPPAPPSAPSPPPPGAAPPAADGGTRRRFPLWIPAAAAVVVLGIVAALALGGGGGGGDDGDETFERTEDGTFFDPAVVQTLNGDWFFSGFATECEGLDDEECAALADDATASLTFVCDGESCEAGVDGSDLQFLGDDGESGLFAEGPLPDDGGFECDDGPDPTTFQLFIFDIDTDDDEVATSLDASVTFTSQDGDTDGNSCSFRFVTAEGEATPTDDGSGDDGAPAITVTLDWSSNADLDLDVLDPDDSSGDRAEDANSGCPEDADSGQEVVTFDEALSGTYTVDVLAFDVDSEGCGPGDYVVTVSVEGQDDQTFEGTLSTDEGAQHTFEVP